MNKKGQRVSQKHRKNRQRMKQRIRDRMAAAGKSPQAKAGK